MLPPRRGIGAGRVPKARAVNSNAVPWRYSTEHTVHFAFAGVIETALLLPKLQGIFSHQNIWNANQAPWIQMIQNWLRKFEPTGLTLTSLQSGRPGTSRGQENLWVYENVFESNFICPLKHGLLSEICCSRSLGSWLGRSHAIYNDNDLE